MKYKVVTRLWVMLIVLSVHKHFAVAAACRYRDQNGAFLSSSSTQIKDMITGLIWQRSYGSSKTWSATAAAGSAQEYCNTLTLGGQFWRLPTAKELLTLADFTRTSVSIDLDVFPGTPASAFWSSTLVPTYDALKWAVNFTCGELLHNDISTPHNIRCCVTTTCSVPTTTGLLAAWSQTGGTY